MIQGGKMKYNRRLQKLEKVVKKEEFIPGVAIRFPDGTIDWNDQTFANEEDFHQAVDRAYEGRPNPNGPRAIIINFHRERETISKVPSKTADK